jgi:hypothetical protein
VSPFGRSAHTHHHNRYGHSMAHTMALYYGIVLKALMQPVTRDRCRTCRVRSLEIQM